MIKKFLINILLILFFLFIAELFCFFATKAENDEFKIKASKIEGYNALDFKTKYKLLENYNPSIIRRSSIKENTIKKPIILFGCSFAEGAGLKDEFTPCFKLSKYSNRSCIVRAKGSTSTQFMYYQLLNDKFKQDFPEADYFIYVYIPDHIRRLYLYQINPLVYMLNLRYELKNDKLTEIKPKFRFIYSSFLVKRLLNRYIYESREKEAVDYNLFNALMRDTAKIIKEKYTDSKFIMIEFPDTTHQQLPEREIKTLEKYGITVVRAKNIIGDVDIYDKKYWLDDGIHPTSELWDLFLPEFVKLYLNQRY